MQSPSNINRKDLLFNLGTESNKGSNNRDPTGFFAGPSNSN